MLFNSFSFFVFFPIVFILYYLLPHKYRWVLLLIASYVFYMSWNPKYIVLIVFSTVIDYWCSKRMGAISEKKKRWPWLILSFVSNLGLLMYFKYYNFFIDNLNHLSGVQFPYMKWLLPVGISFYTFQTLSYTIDVYYGKLKPIHHFGKFALFVSFFPQLVAGPIERASHLLPQFQRKIKFDYHNLTWGLKRAIWGLFKKVVIADNIAALVNAAYDHPTNQEGLTLWFASYLFAFQIYCDFSGYSDIAIGIARMLGFDLMENFKLPYNADSFRQFWRKWHISLSSWFRDYVYIPLGGNKVSLSRMHINLMIVFIVSGFWHGANWTFIIWGALHGLYLILENILGKKIHIRSKLIRQLLVFHLVVIAWIFFRANTLADAWYITKSILMLDFNTSQFLSFINQFNNGKVLFKILLVMYFLLIDFYWIQRILNVPKKRIPKIAFYAINFAIILLFGYWGEVEFIYFQF